MFFFPMNNKLYDKQCIICFNEKTLYCQITKSWYTIDYLFTGRFGFTNVIILSSSGFRSNRRPKEARYLCFASHPEYTHRRRQTPSCPATLETNSYIIHERRPISSVPQQIGMRCWVLASTTNHPPHHLLCCHCCCCWHCCTAAVSTFRHCTDGVSSIGV